MILVDPKGYRKEESSLPRQFVNQIKALGVQSEIGDLPAADFAFEGRGPDGGIAVGIERKALHDMLACIEDSRFASHQRLQMKSLYDVSVLMVEGHWKPHNPNGLLMEGFHNGSSWGYCRPGSQRVMYHKLYRYLISLQLAGVVVSHARDTFETAFNVVEWFHYFQKKWEGHTSLQEMQKVALPQLHGKPSLVRKWAFDIEAIGVKKSELAARIFGTGLKLAQADEREWLQVPGVGVKTAQEIVREIWTGKR